MKLFDVTVVGEIYIDHVFSGFLSWPQPGEEVFTRDYVQELGGGAGNTACGLSLLGRKVQLMGVIGQEESTWIRTRLQDYGVLSDNLVTMPGRTGVTVSVSTREDRSFFTYIGANAELSSMLGDDDVLARLQQSRHVHFALPLDPHLAVRLLPGLRSAGCTTSLDVGYQPAWLGDLESLVVCRAVDYVLPNEREAALMCHSSADDYLAFTERAGLPCGVLKLGPRGAAMTSGGIHYSVLSPDIDVVDTTGAGDAFNAGFIDALLDDASPQDCLRRGCVCGGLSTRVAGAIGGLPRREQIENLYEQTYTT